MSDASAVRHLPTAARPADATQTPDWSAAPLSLERTRLLLNWLRAQRAVDQYLSELLAAGPAGERRVGGHIERVDELVASAAAAFEAYRESVTDADDPAPDASAVVTLSDHRPSGRAGQPTLSDAST